MANTQKLSAAEEAIRDAQNTARDYLPPELDKRVALIHNLTTKAEAEKKAVEEAKADVGFADTKKALSTKHRYEPESLAIILKLEKKEPTLRARILAQVFGHAEDCGYFLRDLFDADAVGTAQGEADGQEAVFDTTANGRSRAATPAQPRSVEQMQASHEPAPTPGLPLDEALRLFEAENAKVAGKRGAKPKTWKDAKAALDAAQAAADAAKAEGATEAPAEPAAAADGPADLPEAKPGEITAGLKAVADAGEKHIADQVAAGQEKADKPRRNTRKKAAAPEPAPQAAAEEDPEPPAPPAEDDDEDDAIDVASLNPGGVGTAESTYGVSME